jgi:hypothetical protein
LLALPIPGTPLFLTGLGWCDIAGPGSYPAASDLGRPRDNTRLGALTNITPMQANFHEALQGVKLRTDKMFNNLDMERATIVDQSQNWLKKLDQK